MTNNDENCQSKSSNRIMIDTCSKSKTSSKCLNDKCNTNKLFVSSCNSDNKSYSDHSSDSSVLNKSKNNCKTKSSKKCNSNSESIDCYSNSIDSVNNKLDIGFNKYNKYTGLILNERKLVNKMISNYYNPNSVCLEDNRKALKRLLPIYNNLIDTCFTFVEKVAKIQHNLNPTKSSKVFRLIYESYRTLVFNLYRNFSSILCIKYKGVDVLEYTINNIDSTNSNRINYASCNNYYETDSSLEKSTLFYSVPGLTILFNNDTLSYRVIAKKSNFNSPYKIFKYDFLLIPGSETKCNKISKSSFLKVFDSIVNFRNDSCNNLLEFINFLQHESKSIKCVL